MQALVEMVDVVKKFSGVTALQNISFQILPGEVHVLLGENGAGKSTLMKILSGVYAPTGGRIILQGKSYARLTPKDARKEGISVIYQELSVVDTLSVAENLFLGHLPSRTFGGIPLVDHAELKKRAEMLIKTVGLKCSADTPVETLSICEKQQVEIAKALALDSRVLIMDEPTTSLTHDEVKQLFTVIRKLKAAGKGIVFISHKLPEIMEIGDRVTVLKDGNYVGTRAIDAVTPDDLVKMMVGREIQKNYQHAVAPDAYQKAEVLFEVQHLSRKDEKVKDVSFTLHRGEILGFSGLVGSGRTEMMHAVFGAEPKSSGHVFLKHREINTKNPYNAIQSGLAMLTENRRKSGFFKNFNIQENISIVPFVKTSFLGGVGGLVHRKAELEWAKTQKEDLRIKCAGLTQNITELSGGNQQKVILGKWLAADSQIIILDEPTKGIDVGSKGEIYALMRRLADAGRGILVISSELPELLAVCDTIAVCREGKIVKTFPIAEATEEKILAVSTQDEKYEVQA